MFTTPTLLSDKDRTAQLKAILQRFRKLYDPARWGDPETFERNFEDEHISASSALSRLKESFMFTMRVGRGATKREAPPRVAARQSPRAR